MFDSRASDNEISRRDIPSFIEPRPPLISNPFMRPRPQKGTNLLELFEDDSECEEPELVQVYLRLKPCNNPSNLYEVRSDRYLITSLDTATAGHGRRTQHNVSKMYTFSQIFGPETNQKEIFENVVKDNLKKLPEGNSFTLLTYGASGSGKTFTLMGTVASPGLVPRSLEYVFKMVDAAQKPVFKPSESGADKLSSVQQEYELQWMKRLQISAPLKDKYRRMSVQLRNDLAASHHDLSNRSEHYVWVSFIEIYNEGIYDLLAQGDRRNAQKLAIREDSSGNVYVKGATQAFVRSGEEAYDIMVAGKHNLQVAATGVHAQSSRSHCIFTITMLTESDSGVSASHVRLCDLAGCERAARTRNTGARMCESRAINSSLHVLERCLRALRRRRPPAANGPLARALRRRELVPYRESKLTRLLGSGLSGARGEAVGMVVTLNPSPDYANETRHVLQLAAVAKDIQINSTLSDYPSSLEITQDTTVEFSTEVMKLRAENERLHFELVQAQTRNKELLSCMERHQAAGADAVRELVDEARDITRHYYEEQLRALRDEMDEMAQEYESKLNAVEVFKTETPSRSMETKINQLMTDIAILEEKLTAEKLARGRVEEEVQHLRACIEERDEKTDEVAIDENVSLTDSDGEEEDSCNESLEPTFRKEDINKSRLLRQSAIQAEQSDCDYSVLDKTNDTLKDDSRGYESSEDVCGNASDASGRESVDNTESKICTVKKAYLRNTYSAEEIITKDSDSNVHTKLSRETYCVMDNSETTFNNDKLRTEEHHKSVQNKIADENDIVTKFDDKQPNSFVNKIISSIKKSTDSNNSLAQFERLELAAKTCDDKLSTEIFTDINILKEKRNFFDDGTKSPATKERKIYFTNLNIEEPKTLLDKAKHTDDYRSPSIVKEELTHDFTPSMIKKLLGESKRQGGNMVQPKIFSKTHDSIDLFEFDSPQVHAKIGDVETVRKSVANIVISDEETKDKELITCEIKPVVEEIVKETCSYENAIAQQDVRKSVIIKNTEITTNSIDTNAQYIVKQQSPSKNEVSSKQIDVNAIKVELKFDDKVRDSLKPKRSYFEDEIQIESTVQKSENIFEDISKKPSLQEKKATVPNEDLTKQNSEDSQSEIHNTNVDNTIEQFDNIYKDVTAPNAGDFELLLSQENRESSVEENNNSNNREKSDDVKYNLRNKKSENPKPDTKKEIKDKPKRMNLRLRRRKNYEEDHSEKEVNFRDIVNLQSEFSDVTMDVPASAKTVKDIPSPKKAEYENLPPMLGIQSCPSKSVTRSRRKLFTPRAEPLDESGRAGDSSERVCVPRPSYRPRARRKL